MLSVMLPSGEILKSMEWLNHHGQRCSSVDLRKHPPLLMGWPINILYSCYSFTNLTVLFLVASQNELIGSDKTGSLQSVSSHHRLFSVHSIFRNNDHALDVANSISVAIGHENWQK